MCCGLSRCEMLCCFPAAARVSEEESFEEKKTKWKKTDLLLFRLLDQIFPLRRQSSYCGIHVLLIGQSGENIEIESKRPMSFLSYSLTADYIR